MSNANNRKYSLIRKSLNEIHYSKRNLWFVPGEDGKYTAKYTGFVYKNEIAAFQISQLLGTPYVPLSTKIPASDEIKQGKSCG